MKPLTCYLLSISLLFTCCTGSSGSKDLNVPDAVIIAKKGKHQQIPGTRIFIVKPDGYKLLPGIYKLQKDRQTFIGLQEDPIVGYKWRKEAILQTFEETRASGLPLYYKKEFKLGNDSAFIFYGRGGTPPKDEVVLVFGSHNYLVTAGSEMPIDDAAARKEILSSLLSIYIDTLAKPDFRAFADFTINLSGSAFQFDGYQDQTFYYTPDGEGLTYDDPYDTEIMVKQLQPMEDIKEKKACGDSLIKKFSEAQTAISNRKERMLKINGKNAYEISYDAKFFRHRIKVYQVIAGGPGPTVCFRGIAFDEDAGLYSQFEKIAGTLK